MALVYLESEQASETFGSARFVCAEGGGGRELIANRLHKLEWESFVLADSEYPLRIGDWIALKAYNGQYVGVGDGNWLVANRNSVGSAEIFVLESFGRVLPNGTHVDNSRTERDPEASVDPSGRGTKVALRAAVNGLYVYADDWGRGWLRANGADHLSWERFYIGFTGGNRARTQYSTWRDFPAIQ